MVGAECVELGGTVRRLAQADDAGVADALEERSDVDLTGLAGNRLGHLVEQPGDGRRGARLPRAAGPRLLVPSLRPDEWNESNVAEILALEAAIRLPRHSDEGLEAAVLPDRDHESAPNGELPKERIGDVRSARSDHDGVVRGVRVPPEGAVAVQNVDGVEAELPQTGRGSVGQLGVALDGVDLTCDAAEDRGGVARARPISSTRSLARARGATSSARRCRAERSSAPPRSGAGNPRRRTPRAWAGGTPHRVKDHMASRTAGSRMPRATRCLRTMWSRAAGRSDMWKRVVQGACQCAPAAHPERFSICLAGSPTPCFLSWRRWLRRRAGSRR